MPLSRLATGPPSGTLARMVTVPLEKITAYCDGLLKTGLHEDWPGAANGLQVENRGRVSRLSAAVDASLATVRLAVAARADLLLVHHGLFWAPSHPWTGRKYELVRLLIENNLAVYSSHLPLDEHPRLGNNARLCEALGWKNRQPFFLDKGRPLGCKVRASIARRDLTARLAGVLGKSPILLPGGPEQCRVIGVVSGAAGGQLGLAAAEGVDTFITGEGPHWSFAQAEELGINVFYGGHYATETWGVKALGEHLAAKFKLPWSFLDHPTGL